MGKKEKDLPMFAHSAVGDVDVWQSIADAEALDSIRTLLDANEPEFAHWVRIILERVGR